MTVFIRYSFILIGMVMIVAPMSDPIVRFGVGPCVLLAGVFVRKLANLLDAALDDQAVSGTFLWTGYLPADDEIGKPPAEKVSGDYGKQWNYQATEPIVQSLVNSLQQGGELTVLGEPFAEDHGWHLLMNIGGWKCDLLIQWEGHERERFGFRAYFRAHVYHRLRGQAQFGRQTQQLKSSLQTLFVNSRNIVNVDWAGDEQSQAP